MGQEHQQTLIPSALPLSGVQYLWFPGAGAGWGPLQQWDALPRRCPGTHLFPQISPRSITGAPLAQWVRQYLTCHSFIGLCITQWDNGVNA